MNENRPSKKQRELLSFIDGFIKGNGYGPSYREIMRALDYRSVSTVAVHVDGLITRGLLRKTDNSARSLEVISESAAVQKVEPDLAVLLQKEIAKRTKQLKTSPSAAVEHELMVLEEATTILGLSATGKTSV